MNGFKLGCDHGAMTFKEALSMLYPLIDKVDDKDIASALRCAADMAACDGNDNDVYDAVDNLPITARLLFELMNAYFFLGE